MATQQIGIPATVLFNITLDIVAPITFSFPITLIIKPAKIVMAIDVIESYSQITLIPIPLRIKDAFLQNSNQLLSGKIENYFDNDRVLKTLLNFGGDYQALLTNYQYDTSGNPDSIILKLYSPLPSDVTTGRSVFISRELAYPLVDQLFVVQLPNNSVKIYLRPPNKKVSTTGQYGQSVNNVTFETLLSSGAFSPIGQQDEVMEKWFTTALAGAELNVDYSNYRNFVFFGSATEKLNAFKQKLTLLENYSLVLSQNSASLALTGSYNITGSLAYPAIYELSQERQNIIRSFDGYEKFLYYNTGIPVSGTFESDFYKTEHDVLYFNEDGTWPKIGGSIAPIASSSGWFVSQSSIATAYDEWNINRFRNNLPNYIVNDSDSDEFIKFVDMAGQSFDIIKLYIDNMSSIYDRNNDPVVGMSQDLVWNVGNAFGISMPNQYAIKSLVDYTVGSGSLSSVSYRTVVAETWKRFLHNQIFLMKSKGTKTALRALLNTYGVLPTAVQIRESSTPSLFYATQSFETIEEQTTMLNLESGSYVTIPWSSSVGNAPQTMQVRFATEIQNSSQVIFNVDSTWALTIQPQGGIYYTVAAISGSTSLLSSSLFPIGNGDFCDVMLRYTNTGVYLYVAQTDSSGEISEQFSVQESSPVLSSKWNSGQSLYLGGSGSQYGTPIKATIDEFRIWGEQTTDQTFYDWAAYPGLYNGNLSTSARDALWVRLSFNTPKNLGSSSLADRKIFNESPYQRNASAPLSMVSFPAVNFPDEEIAPYSMAVTNRIVKRFTPNAGGSQYDTNKIIIADPAQLIYISGSTVPVLSRTTSIVTPDTKINTYKRSSNMVGFFFSITEAINDSIIRSMGNINIHDYIGDPRNQFAASYKDLATLDNLYWTTYAYTFNANAFTEFVQSLLGPMFEQAKELVPVRAKLLSGVVTEPHILERNKISSYPVGFNNTSYDAGAMAEETPVTTTAIFPTYDIILDTTTTTIPVATNTTYAGSITYSSSYEVAASYTSMYGILDLINGENEFTVNASDNSYNSSIDIYADVWQLATDSFNSAVLAGYLPSQSAVTPVYGPASDLQYDLGATNYFTYSNGLVGLLTYVPVRVRQSVLVSRGNWSAVNTYNRDDYVVQAGNGGNPDASPGSGSEFYAIQNNFKSIVPPYLDNTNWRPVKYIQTAVMKPALAVLISGSLSIVPTGSAFTPVTGYLPQHFRYYKPTYTAFKRLRYTGCVVTDADSFDGNPPVVIGISAGDTLFVTNQGTPVQSSQNIVGPILDVK